MKSPLLEAYHRLLDAYGPQGWWPADSPVEVMIGAVLVQHTDWRNAARAIANLRGRGLLDARRLCASTDEELHPLLRPAGAYRVKARRLRNLLRLVVDGHGGDADALLALPTGELRQALLAVSGVGPETADAIVLYAANRPRFVVDAYTRRVVERHGWHDGEPTYDALQRRFEGELPADAALFNEYHALLVEVGKRHCGTKAKCEGCPLQPLLPRREV